MLESKPRPGRSPVIPKWAVASLQKKLEQPDGFKSYGAVQRWMEETLGVRATYHTVYQLTRYRLKAKLKVARPQNSKQEPQRLEQFKKPRPRPQMAKAVPQRRPSNSVLLPR